ncbi:MAG: ABC transporter permease subunit [Thermoflexaceae bacterium]|nr:ABC transporter permease subunit [Thermoflexaceae bacterium]
MKIAKIKAIYKKEILDLMRDKKTLIMMVLVPLLLYPLIFVGAMLISSAVMNSMQSSEYQIAVVAATDVFNDRDELVTLLEDTEDELEYHLKVVEEDEPQAALLSEDIDAYVVVGQKEGKVTFNVYYMSSVTNSSTASDMVEDKLEIYERKTEEKLLKELGLDAEHIMNPVEVTWNDQSNKEEKLGSIMGSILPFLLITSILMGAVYPSIDTTAGEKERGTLETLLTLPVRNDELIMGKFLAVATISVISALLNLLSMGIMAGFLFSIMNTTETDTAGLNLTGFIPAALIVVLCVVAFALFISAITMCVTTFAKSFKEANNYVTPLLLVVMFTGYIGFIPNIEFTPLMASIPVVNICLLISNLLVFKYNFYLILIVLVTNVAYAVLAVWVLSRIYDSEDVLFGEGGMSLQIFTSRKDLKQGGVPNFSDAILVAAVSMLLLLYVGTVVQMKFLLFGLLITQFMIIGVPVFAAWYTKKDFKETFSLKVPKITGILGAVLLEIGTFTLVMALSVFLTKLWPQDVDGVNQSFEMMLDGVTFVPALLVLGLAPAICEEALFRGYLFSAAKKKMKPVAAILLIAALFGIYHLSFVKFFTTGILGIVFCYVVYKTGSIVLSCLMHFMNNAFSVVLMYYGKQLHEVVPVLFKETLSGGEIVMMLVVVILCSGVGLVLLHLEYRNHVIRGKL